MTGPSVLIGNVDELTAHFAEWFLFLKAKGYELEAQQSKLEARKTKVSTPSPGGERDFLDIVFEAQTKARVTGIPAEPAPEANAEVLGDLTQTTGDLASPITGDFDACEAASPLGPTPDEEDDLA
jgi:hypothetical protein